MYHGLYKSGTRVITVPAQLVAVISIVYDYHQQAASKQPGKDGGRRGLKHRTAHASIGRLEKNWGV